MLSRANLHDYQNRTVEFIKTKKRCGAFLEMGLGKSVSTLTAVTDLIDEFSVRKVLVIAPLRVANSVWAQEVAKWKHLEHLRVSVCTGAEKNRRAALHRDADIYVINRENVVWLVELFGKKWPFDMVVVDESSSFKNPSSKRFRALKKVLPFTNYMVVLTGTPSPNGLIDLWSQIYLIDFGESLGRTITGYRQRFFDQDYMGRNWILRNGSADKIQNLISDRVISMSAEDYLSLPERIDLSEKITLPLEAMRRYKEFEKTLLAQLETGEEVEAMTAATLANKLLQFASGSMYVDEHKNYAEIHSAKLDALAEIVEENEGENILVAYNYRFDLERLLKRFPQAVLLDKEQSTIDRWNRGEIKMLLAHPACLHPKTEVLTENRGWVKIVDVKDNERVFDGIEFVSHSGCYFSGIKSVIERFGIKMTHDHKILVDGQWEKAKDVRDTKGIRGKARYSYTGDDSYLSEMLTLRECRQDIGAERPSSKPPAEKVLCEVYRRHFSQHDQHSDLENLASYAGEDYKRKIAGFQKLWWTWDYCVGRLVKVRKLLSGHGSDIQRRFNFGEGQQFERLLQGKLSLGHKYGAAIQQKEQSRFGISRAKYALGGILPKSWCVQRSDNGAFECGNDSRTGSFGLSKQQVSQEQEISEVYDLVDCGPRNRFVVRNGDGEVFISHNSAGHGLNIQSGGAIIVWFSLNWSLELYQQFNARLHRQGQEKPVRVIHMLSEGTIDERVMSALGSKDATQSSLLNALKV